MGAKCHKDLILKPTDLSVYKGGVGCKSDMSLSVAGCSLLMWASWRVEAASCAYPSRYECSQKFHVSRVAWLPFLLNSLQTVLPASV